ncbi:b-cell antigen receptor complex-associated protein [Lynx pardinus]|uniref:B-cell antigen receptor complex-associated protein n=1 Tax=Lynx pardinus TaxID=191816 RepID=A0A485MPP2_LYNPA|nr:b-cell antigen receptor complex-associated protein [Lynx pardinus]
MHLAGVVAPETISCFVHCAGPWLPWLAPRGRADGGLIKTQEAAKPPKQCVCVCVCVCARAHARSPAPCLLPVSSVEGGPTPSIFLHKFCLFLQKVHPTEGSLLPDQHPAHAPSLLRPQTRVAPRASASVGRDTCHWTASRLQSLPCPWPPPPHVHIHSHSGWEQAQARLAGRLLCTVLIINLPLVPLTCELLPSAPPHVDTDRGLNIDQTATYEDIVTLRTGEVKWSVGEHPGQE